ncbi:MAG: hypothetical protein MUQ32_16065 [Chloroflexi bacterium]|nr:hypothetical protein [Chloroflexota bacterium]
MRIAAPFADARGRLAVRVGTLASGRHADLVAVDGDPLADSTVLARPVAVPRGGRPVLGQQAG